MATTPTNTPTPAPKTNRIGLQVIDYRGGKTTLCAGCGHNAISERIIDAMYEMGVPPERVAKFSGIGCSSKSPAYFMNRSHSFQLGARTHAFGGDGSDAGEQELARAGRDRRRRHGFDRRGAICPPDAAQSADHLHHRGQRLLRVDEGAVLGDGRSGIDAEERHGERPASDRYLRHGDSAGRDFRWAIVLGRQEAAAHHAEGGDCAQRER